MRARYHISLWGPYNKKIIKTKFSIILLSYGGTHIGITCSSLLPLHARAAVICAARIPNHLARINTVFGGYRLETEYPYCRAIDGCNSFAEGIPTSNSIYESYIPLNSHST